MKIKSLQKAFEYGFKSIIKREDLPYNKWEWSDNITDQECDEFHKAEELSKKIEQENIIVNSYYNELYFYDNCLALNLGHSRRGQCYYILCDKQTLELSIFATNADGDSSSIDFPKVIYEMIINQDVIL